jgi:hypothetical protein
MATYRLPARARHARQLLAERKIDPDEHYQRMNRVCARAGRLSPEELETRGAAAR